MILRTFGVTLIAASVCAAGLGYAGDKDKKDGGTDSVFAQIVGSGPGVHRIKTDKQGRIQSCIVVGQSRISTVLGTSKGLQLARDSARLAASAEFRKWLKEKVSVHEKSEAETILFIEGSEENDKDALRESGKSVEKQSKKMESISVGLVRGLQVLGSDVNSKEKTYTIVMGWDAKTAAAVKKVDADLKDSKEKKSDSSVGKEKDEKKGETDKKKGEADKKKLQDKRSISPDLKKFFD
jgi:hypothetical protein